MTAALAKWSNNVSIVVNFLALGLLCILRGSVHSFLVDNLLLSDDLSLQLRVIDSIVSRAYN